MGPSYQALRENAAYLDLSSRGKIFASGEDRLRLLHAMTTNQVKELQPGQGCYAFFLNPQGRIIADANLFVLPDRILLDVEPELTDKPGAPALERIRGELSFEDVTFAYKPRRARKNVDKSVSAPLEAGLPAPGPATGLPALRGASASWLSCP